jgi:hypothetical protein
LLFFDAFKEYLSERGKWNSELDLILKIIKEQSNIVQHKKSTAPLFSINQSIRLNDSWLNEYKKEFNQCLSGDKFIDEINPKRYKTITEYRVLIGVDADKLLNVYTKYHDFNHPLVNYETASVLYTAKNYSQGLPILFDGIKSIVSFPINYWDNEAGIEGATWLLYDLLFLIEGGLEKIGLRDEKIKLMKLLFLYFSRYICMTQGNVKCIDFYSNRARFVLSNRMEFHGIFGIGVNPDIQFISDMYLAYLVVSKNQLEGIKDFRQLMIESQKMYEHGSHIPNGSGGYKEIEDKTWMELVEVGEIRSLILADKLLKEFENHELNISNSTLDQIFSHLTEIKKDDLENYLQKINMNKL